MYDFGYDVFDYCDVDLVFGLFVDFDVLVEVVHERGLCVFIDWVFVYSLSEYFWFVEVIFLKDSVKRDWYVW